MARRRAALGAESEFLEDCFARARVTARSRDPNTHHSEKIVEHGASALHRGGAFSSPPGNKGDNKTTV